MKKKKTHDEINSFRPIRYIADMSESNARRTEGNIGEDAFFSYGPGRETALVRGDTPNGSCAEPFYIILIDHASAPNRACAIHLG